MRKPGDHSDLDRLTGLRMCVGREFLTFEVKQDDLTTSCKQVFDSTGLSGESHVKMLTIRKRMFYVGVSNLSPVICVYLVGLVPPWIVLYPGMHALCYTIKYPSNMNLSRKHCIFVFSLLRSSPTRRFETLEVLLFVLPKFKENNILSQTIHFKIRLYPDNKNTIFFHFFSTSIVYV
jgi:hypothetical protein